MEWTTHPARTRPVAALPAASAILAAGYLVGTTAANPVAGLAAVVLLTAALRTFFFPTRHGVDAHGVTLRCLGVETRRPWARVRRFRHDDAGAFLSTRARPSLLDSWTGLHLTWAGNRNEVVPMIERYLAEHGRGETVWPERNAPSPATLGPSPQREGRRSAASGGGS